MDTHAILLRKRKLANREGDNPEKGKPIPGERNAAHTARVARRLVVRAHKRHSQELERQAKEPQQLAVRYALRPQNL
jgi:hypothetical protein